MKQYRLWLYHRQVDQDLRGQYRTYEEKLAKIDGQIAHLEKSVRPTNNEFLRFLMQEANFQEQENSQTIKTVLTQPGHNGATQEQTQRRFQPLSPPSSGPRNIPVPPSELTWSGHFPLGVQEAHLSEESRISTHAIPVLPEMLAQPLPNDSITPVDQELSQNEQVSLPWWLRDLMSTTNGEEKTQQAMPVDQQATHTNQRVERWFTRRSTLTPPGMSQEDQK